MFSVCSVCKYIRVVSAICCVCVRVCSVCVLYALLKVFTNWLNGDLFFQPVAQPIVKPLPYDQHHLSKKLTILALRD